MMPAIRGLSFQAQRNRGTLVVAIVVDREGRIGDAEVLSGIDRRTDRRILSSLAATRHQPAELDTVPTAWMMTFVMRLDFGAEPAAATDRAENRILPVGMLVDRHAALAAIESELRVLTEVPADERGWILVGARIGTEGRVASVRLLEGFHPLLDDAVLDEVRRFRYQPAEIAGQPIEWAVTVRYPVAWNF